MKKLALAISLVVFSAVAASAADMAPRYTKALPPPVAYSWTGCYIGAEAGYNAGHSSHIYDDRSANPALVGLSEVPGGFDLSGGIAGGTVGCNYQFGQFVVGSETDFSWTNKSGSAVEVPPFNINNTVSTNEKWLETSRVRVGYAWDRLLVYGTGGGAIAKEGFSVCSTITGCAGSSRAVVGWSAGVGLEYAVWTNFSVKLEYLHTDFGSSSFSRVFPPGPDLFNERRVTLTDDMVRAGINYKLNIF